MKSFLKSAENSLSAFVLAAMVLLPFIEIVSRRLIGEGIPGSIEYVRHLTLWIAFLGAALAAREERHLSLSAIPNLLKGNWKNAAGIFAAAVATAITLLLTIASAKFVWLERESVTRLGGGVPIWIVQTIMPIGFAWVAFRFLWKTPTGWKGRLITLAVCIAVVCLNYLPDESHSKLLWPGVMAILAATALGAPIFTVLGGFALLFFFGEDVPIAAIPVESYRMASSPILPTIPLFTLAGSLLAKGGASKRLVRVFRALFGSFAGGTAVAAIVVSAFFTTFTGASGVTILALGALLLPILLEEKYGEKFSIGMLTAAGGLGTVFPPCLPVILYGVVSHTPIDQLFLAGLLPGTLLVAVVCIYAVRQGRAVHVERHKFDLKESFSALWDAKWEVVLPVVVILFLFSGYATLVEAAALTALYAFLVEYFVYKDINLTNDTPEVLIDCSVMVGGVLIILATAMGFTNYLVDAQIPSMAAEWVQGKIHSQWVFLLALNGFLIVVGCLMDVFSAIVVVVPLIIPIAEVFSVDPIQLGIVFLINLQLGFITPPVGVNLFLSSFRFEKPLGEVYRASFPFLLVMLIGVLMVTYMPFLTVGFLHLLGK